jgi:tetratricopeptide (TPR) repeat protein
VRTEQAYAYGKLGRGDEARDSFAEAMRLLPHDAQLYRYRGELSNARGKYADAADDFTRAIALDPADAQNYLRRGAARAAGAGGAADWHAAIDDYTAALERAPESGRSFQAGAYNRRGNARFALKEYAEAVDDYTRSIGRNPKDPVVYRNRAGAYQELGNAAAAEADEKAAQELEGMKP